MLVFATLKCIGEARCAKPYIKVKAINRATKSHANKMLAVMIWQYGQKYYDIPIKETFEN